MRSIDGDKLKRKAQECATEAWKMNLTARIETVLNQFIDWIDEAPTVEPEIVRCKDCKWHSGEYHCIDADSWGFYDNDFCSHAERRVDEGD
jgi:hypothetical protein